ncbi:helix-turn-helix domain-containing protein [Mucilaginibacter polytrichastri]|uniref:helix-turn-helix domain-containing protein n=1 Tax=Mucilaginibacter polytrichastri TaxID=1302689 RepID=UPI0008E1A081|nr:helix-turn-helix domain-containing protein [Mucilaginibacter polytrichastri]SFS58685.1 hypothetical protein SAMN04487890_10234 [Mucilaginibacter polytrichastri]
MEGITIIETAIFNRLIDKVDALEEFVTKTATELSEAKNPYLKVKEAMKLTGFSKTWLMSNKEAIGYASVGGCLIFKRKDLEAYMEANYFKTKSPRRVKS